MSTVFFKLGGCFKRDTNWKELRAWARVEEVEFGVEVGSCAMSCVVEGLNTSLTSYNLTMVAYGSSSWVYEVPKSCSVLSLAYATPAPQRLPACLPLPPPPQPTLGLIICVATILCFMLVLFILAAIYCKFYAGKK
ncbi:hypothetical protein E2C01_091952 [Portunus trituberculatus]|uniref:Uncharacterized protein n=2 Tax=Portunus trituberculatus TaxID=210409 RepID=A0A5B7JPC6_PORTR|nr:hypothetical protein [Portunus trituberculatus]